MADPLAITLADQIKSVRREIGMRQRVYPRWVEGKRMKQEEADREIAAMEAVLATLMVVSATATARGASFDELALRKVVSFELAELVLANRPAQGAML